MGIRDFIRYLEEHREKAAKASELSAEEVEETLKQAEMMVGMAQAAAKSLESVLTHRRVNLSEEHALRFAQDVFTYLKEQEEQIKERLEAAR
jgi:predicted transcriptional regulator